MNAKRIWRRGRLKVPQKQPKKGSLWLNDGSCVRLRPEHLNHVWRGAIVNNESSEILRMMNSGFDTLANASVDLYPVDLRDGIDALNARIYPKMNNGVYRAGFATTQVAYEEACHGVFEMLDEFETRLGDGRSFLSGERFTEADPAGRGFRQEITMKSL